MKQLQQKIQYILCMLLLATPSMYGQSNVEGLTKLHIEQNRAKYNLTTEDVKEWSISSHHVSKHSGIHHIYGNQQLNGLDIYQATFSLHLRDNQTEIAFHNKFISNLKDKVKSKSISPSISATEALEFAIQHLNLDPNSTISVLETKSNFEFILETKEISTSQIPIKMIYFSTKQNEYVLAWELTIDDFKNNSLWNIKIDAASGNILDKKDMVLRCDTNDHDHSEDISLSPKKEKPISYDAHYSTLFMNETYRVYALPIESPLNGERSLVVNPYDIVASQEGWHSIPNSPEYFSTRGNNINAYSDTFGSNSSSFTPFSGSYTFDYALNTNYSNGDYAAAVTNLFYWTNLNHDIWYHYGFDEVSGNFQEDNYANGGSGSDSLIAEAHDSVDLPPTYGVNGNRCKAAYFPTADGQNPRIQMHVCFEFDSALDNLVISHEYGHGISTRLVGGAGVSNPFTNLEQMGEGWSDWIGLMLTIEPGDTGADLRTVGNWYNTQDINGSGIREFPYSTNINDSPYTYEYLEIFNNQYGYRAHDVGSVWASMLWELTWEFIDEYGFDPDLYNGNGGNNKVMELIIESLKLTPSNPGFVQAREAILQADSALNNGENHCYIWRAFAKRGLGINAEQNNTNSLTDGVSSFDSPECLNECFFTSVEITNADRFPSCSELDLNSVYLGFSVSASLIPPANYNLDDFTEDLNAGNITLDIIDHDDPENTVFETYLLYANDTYYMDSNGNIIFHFPILNQTFWGNNTEGNYDFRVNTNLTTDAGYVCIKNDRVRGISFDNCREITCESNTISIDSQIPDFTNLEPPYDFDVCGTFIVHGNYEAIAITLEVYNDLSPTSGFTLTIDNPEISGAIPNAGGGQFGLFCFTLNISDFPSMEGNYTMVATLFTQLRNEECQVDTETPPFSLSGFGQGQTECQKIEKITIEDNLLSWDGNAENYTLIIQTDESCCESPDGPFSLPKEINLQVNKIDLTDLHKKFGKCIRFKIKSECDNTSWCCAVLDEEKWNLPNEDCLKQERKQLDFIKIFPIPATNKVTVSSENSKILFIELYNIYGYPVKTINSINAFIQQIDVNRLSRGYYVIKIILEDGTSKYRNVIFK